MKIKHLESDTILELFLSKSDGEERTICPVCSKDRKKSRVKCFSWNHSKNTGFCSHCQASFVIEDQIAKALYVSRENRDYKKPVWNNTELSDRALKYLESRGISQFAVRQLKVTEAEEWMPQTNAKENTLQFNYFRNNELVNVKYRDGRKNFKLAAKAELIMYNYDLCINSSRIIITEGEIDALSIATAGIYDVTSPPNGAGTGALKMEYIDNCLELFENKTEIIIATDNDAPGINLCQQLAFRLGVERCFRVDFSPFKDANEYLLAKGAESLKNHILMHKKAFPIEGVFTTTDFSSDLDLLFSEGLKPGKQINIPEFDQHLTFETGRLYTWTGIPGCGKSEFLDFVLEKLNVLHGWKTAYFSPENHPLQLHASKIIEKLTGCTFSSKKMHKDVYDSAKEYMKDNFFFIAPNDNFTVDNIIEKARICVFKYGVKNIVIDPYNKLEHQYTTSETQYISQFLDKLTNFAKRNDVAIHLVAHPVKMGKNANGDYEVPTLYNISGSANFFNKTDFGICIYRKPGSSISDIHIQKVKFKHLGEPGMVSFAWNKENGRYTHLQNDDFDRVVHDYDSHISIHYNDEILETKTFANIEADFNNARNAPF
jgi:twinkle protein